MSEAQEKTTTIAQILYEKWCRWWNGEGQSSPVVVPASPLPTQHNLYNPLGMKLGGFVKLDTATYMKYTFSVDKIAEFSRTIGARTLRFTDYVLHDPSEDAPVWVTLRVMPKDGSRGEVDCFLLRQVFESGYNADLVKALEGDTITDQDDGLVFQKSGVYEATIREVTSEEPLVQTVKLRYWDFINTDADPVLYVVELDLSDREGWIEAFRGKPCSKEDVRLIAGHQS